MFLLSIAVALGQTVSVSTADGNGADEDVIEESPADTVGGRGFLELRSRNVTGSLRHRVPFFRLDVSTVTKPIDAATLRFWIASSNVDGDAFAIDVFGVNNAISGEDDWNAASLSYDNAPGLTAGNASIDRDHEITDVTHLGTVSYPGGNYTGGVSLSTSALVDFINADTNNAVTIFLEPQVAATDQDFAVQVRTAEGIGIQANDFAPTLTLTAAVTVTDNGSSVTLGNGAVSATFQKADGRGTDLRRGSGSNLLANGGELYFDSNSGGNYHGFTGSYQLVTNTSSVGHLRFIGRMGEFTAELNYVMQAGEQGFHCYVVFRHGPGDAATYLEQCRMVLRCDPNIFTNAYSAPDKTGQMIAPTLLQNNPTIMDATYQLPLVSSYTNATGFTEDLLPVYTKYDWSSFMENHTVHGLAGDTTGLWLVMGGVEYFNGGPTKQNQKVHGTETTPLMLWVPQGQHFGSSTIDLAAGEPWDKLLGPFLIYANSGTNAAQLWSDAQTRAATEQAAWPCTWMTETNYPIVRGTVSGRLHIAGESSSNALLVLAQPGSYWQEQSDGCQFWTRAAADGSFMIPKVRPGNYTLFARVPGIVGGFTWDNVLVTANQTNALGVLEWNPPRRERRLWRIGTPDLTAREFRFGDQMRQFGLWWRYLEEQGTNDLIFRVGSSAATDWYYAQSTVAMDDGTYFSPKWKVEFVLTNLPPSPAVLTVDAAGTAAGTLLTSVNGSPLSNVSLTNDSAITRSATRSGMFRHLEWSFNPNLLQIGTNTISFQVSKPASWTGTKPVQPVRGIMYDCLQLEAGSLITTPNPQFNHLFTGASNLFLNGAGGPPGGTFWLMTTTNRALPPTSWVIASTNTFDGNGNFSLPEASPVASGEPHRFYRLLLP